MIKTPSTARPCGPRPQAGLLRSDAVADADQPPGEREEDCSERDVEKIGHENDSRREWATVTMRSRRRRPSDDGPAAHDAMQGEGEQEDCQHGFAVELSPGGGRGHPQSRPRSQHEQRIEEATVERPARTGSRPSVAGRPVRRRRKGHDDLRGGLSSRAKPKAKTHQAAVRIRTASIKKALRRLGPPRERRAQAQPVRHRLRRRGRRARRASRRAGSTRAA